jgi:hypothetical protein
LLLQQAQQHGQSTISVVPKNSESKSLVCWQDAQQKKRSHEPKEINKNG